MKRSVLLLSILALVALIWAGMQIKASRQRHWLTTASREELQQFVASHPDNSDALIRLGAAERDAGERSEAEKHLRHAVEIAPADATGWVELARTLTDDEQAIQELKQFQKIDPESTPVMAELSRRYLRVGDATTARDLAARATQHSPGSAEAWCNLGDVMAAYRRLPDAEKAYRKSLSLKDDNETRLSLARLLIPLQRYAEVVEFCSPLLQRGRAPTVSQQQRARALLYTAGARLYDPLTPEELSALQAQLRETEALSATLSPEERFLPPYFLGESFLRQGRPKEAAPYLEKSVVLGPMFAGSLYSLARAYRLSGETAKADVANARHVRLSRILGELEMYSNRLEQRPDDADTMLRLAGTLTEAGNVAQATQIYRRLIAEGKFVDVAQRKLQALPGH